MLSGLSPLTIYEWKVKSQCAAGWKDFTSTSIFITLALKEEELITDSLSDITIYPNPVQGQLNLNLPESISGNLSIRIIDLVGHVVMEENISSNGGVNVMQLNTTALPTGIYLLTINEANMLRASQKFIKQ